MKKTGLVLLCASALVLSLAACAGPAPTPAASPSGDTSSPSASATPSAEAEAEAASVIISVEGITILDTDGETIADFDYFDSDAAEAVAALTDAFGAVPVLSKTGSTNHPETNADVSDWSGFELRDMTAETLYPHVPSFKVSATVAESNGIAIRTTDGVHVGMPLSEVEPLSYRSWVDTGTGTDMPIFLLEQLPVEIDGGSDYEPAALSISVSGKAPADTVILISAPGANFGA